MAGARELVESFYDAFNRGDLDAAREYFSDDVENRDPAGSLSGWDSFRQYIGVFKGASPDSKLNAKTWIDGGDVVAVEGTFTGTFTNPLPTPEGELQPTGKPFEVSFVEVNQAHDGRITSHRVYYDQIAFLTALGAMPSQGAPPAASGRCRRSAKVGGSRRCWSSSFFVGLDGGRLVGGRGPAGEEVERIV